MSSARQVNELAKNISCVEIAQRKQAKRKSTSSQGLAARAYERATAWQRGEGGHVTRSTSEQLEQTPNLRSVLSLVESSTDFLEALQDTYKSLTTGMTLPCTPNPQMPQKGHTTGGKKSKKNKSERRSTSDQDTTQLEEEQEQQQPLSATFLDNARFEDQGQKKQEGHPDRYKVREIARKVGRSDQIWMNLTRILTLIYLCILLTIRNSALNKWYEQCPCSLLMLFNRSAKR
jgi:hypothetical protein